MPLSSPAKVLSTEELFAQVRELQPKVAVFDCDGTLWSGDAGSSFMWWSMETGLLSAEKEAWLRGRYQGYREGTVSELTICGDMVQVYTGISEDTLRSAAEQFFAERIEGHIFPELRRLFDSLQQQQLEIWAVSSTNNWVIEAGVRRFGLAAHRVLAAEVRVRGGRATDELVDVPTDDGKVAALRRAGVTTPDAVFGNSVHDAAMLAIARQAFPINPTPGLLERSAQEGWAVYHPAEAAHPKDQHISSS